MKFKCFTVSTHFLCSISVPFSLTYLFIFCRQHIYYTCLSVCYASLFCFLFIHLLLSIVTFSSTLTLIEVPFYFALNYAEFLLCCYFTNSFLALFAFLFLHSTLSCLLCLFLHTCLVFMSLSVKHVRTHTQNIHMHRHTYKCSHLSLVQINQFIFISSHRNTN